jgi:hypothetical protein
MNNEVTFSMKIIDEGSNTVKKISCCSLSKDTDYNLITQIAVTKL